MTHWIGRLLGIEDLESIHQMHVRFAAPWAEGRPVLVLFLALALAAVGVYFYLRRQRMTGTEDARGKKSSRVRYFLAGLRALVLALLVVILAEPVISMSVTETSRPLLLWLFDGTDSMNLSDKLTSAEQTDLHQAIGDDGTTEPFNIASATRKELVQEVFRTQDREAFDQLSEQCRIRAYVMDRLDQVRELDLAEGASIDAINPRHLADKVQGDGQVTALGTAIEDLARRHRSHTLAGTVIVSDFDQNAGRPAVPAAQRLGAPIYAVGVGAREVVDLAIDLQAPLVLKKDERTTVTAFLRQSGLTGRMARVELLARRLGSSGGLEAESEPKSVTEPVMAKLTDSRVTVEIPYLPDTTGRYMLEARVTPFDGEVLEENNSALREITVRDDWLNLLFVEHEPTWEWRFVKEVFYRDPLIGPDGLRTFLRSSDMKVRRTNDVFLETLVRPRSEFFAYDVIILSDIPAEVLSLRFQEMLKEYVERFGGGLVVITGPRFGARTLASTQVADMLPVVLDESLPIRDRPFPLRRTPLANDTDFMNLGASDQENEIAWKNLGPLPWYQPVARPHPLATVLAEHPRDVCVDDETPQPLIAVRRYGKGEVVYLGFNETWRLRRRYGEKYYRQFWGQLIYRLGLGRSLGEQKRFQVATDRTTYQAGDRVRLTVEAYDKDFQPLETDRLAARLITGPRSGEASASRELSVPLARDQVVFEVDVPVHADGRHRLLVRDPVTDEETEVNFTVAPLAVERRNAVRDTALQTALASQTGGRAYELHELSQLVREVKLPQVEETRERRFALWNTWLVLSLVLALMLGEWLTRKLVNLQ